MQQHWAGQPWNGHFYLLFSKPALLRFHSWGHHSRCRPRMPSFNAPIASLDPKDYNSTRHLGCRPLWTRARCIKRAPKEPQNPEISILIQFLPQTGILAQTMFIRDLICTYGSNGVGSMVYDYLLPLKPLTTLLSSPTSTSFTQLDYLENQHHVMEPTTQLDTQHASFYHRFHNQVSE